MSRSSRLADVLGPALRLAVHRPAAAALGLTTRHEHRRDLPDPPLFRPYTTGRRYGFAHYNLVFPDLPAPHLFMACAVMIGQGGTRVFDDDRVVLHGPRDTATVANGTAATAPDWFRCYSVQQDCELSDDGAVLRFGQEVALTGTFPEFLLTVSRGDFEATIAVHATEHVTWFARSPVYDHIGIPARYEGTIRWAGSDVRVRGVCSFEHARAATLSALTNRPVPAPLKLPVSFFTYQVLQLDDDSLLLLTHVRVLGSALMTTAHVSGVGAGGSHSGRGARFRQGSPGGTKVAPDGSTTSVPSRFAWTATVKGEQIRVDTVLDTEMIYGIGRGWIGGLHFSGSVGGVPVQGRGYVEYVERPFRSSDR